MSRRAEWRNDVAEEMVRLIEAGTAPWQKPWKAGVAFGGPINAATNRPYRGINALWLATQNHDDPRWMTFRQAEELGGQVRAGEKSSLIEYWQWDRRERVLDEGGKPVLDGDGKETFKTVRLQRPKVFYANVFNAEQVDGLEPYKAPAPSFEPLAEAEKLLAGGGVSIAHDQNERALYAPAQDAIHLPPKAAFRDAYSYYATALHELGHATGHASRLSRDFGPFGSETYAKEELRAEMASWMCARDLGLGHSPERHASYVESWLKTLRDDKNFLFQAARDAERIASWIRQPELRQELERQAQESKRAEVMEKKSEAKEEAISKVSDEKANRYYLTVPFAEKNEARTLGARWDRKAKSWYVPLGHDAGLFSKWVAPRIPVVMASDPMTEFKAVLQDAGIALKGQPLMDGGWHRASLADDPPGKQNASYRAFLDGRPNGQIKNYKTGELTRWVEQGEPFSKALLSVAQAEAESVRKARDAELSQRHEKAAGDAMAEWNKAADVLGPSYVPYLYEKGVSAYGIKLDEAGRVLVPLRDAAGRLWSIQTIAPDGEKRFLKDGKKAGLFHVLDSDNGLTRERGMTPIDTGFVYIAEGYATAATIHEITKRPVVVAFDAGNLKAVAESIRYLHPSALIVIAADNDHGRENKPGGNVGKVRAQEAARAVGGRAVVPEFSEEEKTRGLTDWNDLAKARGTETVAEELRKQLTRQKSRGAARAGAALQPQA